MIKHFSKIFYLIFTLIFSFYLLCFFDFSYIVTAETKEYRRIINNSTPIYEDELKTKMLFNLPYTYYVSLIKSGEILSMVECYGDDNTPSFIGYVNSENLYKDDLEVTSPYLNKQIQTNNATTLYTDYTLSTPICYIFANRNLKYYGSVEYNNQYVFCVSYNGRFGYVVESDIVPFTVENHPNPLTFIKPVTPEQEQKEENNTTFILKIIIFSCLGIAGIIGLFVFIKKPKKRHATLDSQYYDENEYE